MIIQSLYIAQLHDIISYSPFPSGSGQIEVANWIAVPMHPASGEMTISDSHTPAGRSFRTMLSCRLRQSFSIPRACILKVVLCNGDELLIGSPDIPVQPNKNSTLYLDTFTINHDTFHPPLPIWQNAGKVSRKHLPFAPNTSFLPSSRKQNFALNIQ